MSASPDLYAEAIRTVPGILTAKHSDSSEDIRLLLRGYHERAKELGVGQCLAWAILFSAAIHWAHQATLTVSKANDLDYYEIAQTMGELALAWDCNRV